jgi:hypothetical protein
MMLLLQNAIRSNLVFKLRVKLSCPLSVYYSTQKAKVLCKIININLCNKSHKFSLLSLSNNQRFLIRDGMNKYLARHLLVHQIQPESQQSALPAYLEKQKQS